MVYFLSLRTVGTHPSNAPFFKPFRGPVPRFCLSVRARTVRFRAFRQPRADDLKFFGPPVSRQLPFLSATWTKNCSNRSQNRRGMLRFAVRRSFSPTISVPALAASSPSVVESHTTEITEAAIRPARKMLAKETFGKENTSHATPIM